MPENTCFSSSFEIQQEIVPQNLSAIPGFWPCALDIGYSAVKGFCPDRRFIFPSFARRLPGALLTTDESDILVYDTKENETWIVGRNALNGVSSDDTDFAGDEWYDRNRYLTREYRIIVMAALGIASMGSPSGAYVIQSGLPPAYIKQDANVLRKAFLRPMDFVLKIGSGPQKEFHFDFHEEDILPPIPQPVGTLYSVIMGKDGTRIPGWVSYFQDNSIIFDGGFKTLDIYTIRGRQKAASISYSEYGMLEVLTRTSQRIYEEYGEDIPVSHLLPLLKKGTIIISDEDEDEPSAEVVSFGSDLELSSNEICDEAIRKFRAACKPLRDYRHLVVTGGTGAAWFPRIKEKFSHMQSLSVVQGNVNDGLDPVYSNVRGYYYFAADTLRRRIAGQKEGS